MVDDIHSNLPIGSATKYSTASGPYPWKVVIVLEELGIPYETEYVGMADIKKPPYEKINPNGRVPPSTTPTQASRSGNPAQSLNTLPIPTTRKTSSPTPLSQKSTTSSNGSPFKSAVKGSVVREILPREAPQCYQALPGSSSSCFLRPQFGFGGARSS